MSMRNFDLKRWDGLAMIFGFGATFSLYIAAMIISIIATSEGIYTQVVLYDTAFYLVISGALMLIVSIVLMYNNSTAANSAGIVMDSSIRNVVLGLFLLTILSMVLYGTIPNFV